jgi:GNAT superfamily N-acetyltransferase
VNSHLLRLATADDIPELHRIRMAVRENRLSDPTHITHDDYLAALEQTGRTWLLEEDGTVRAFGTGFRDGSIWALFVDPEHEGRGYGHALHEVVVDWLWSLGHERLWLTTGPDTRAARFYAAHGWVAVGAVDNGDLRIELSRR